MWAVDNGASRHFSAVSSNFSSRILDDQLGKVSGINCKIEGSGTISFFVHGRLGKPVYMNLLNVLCVPSLANRLSGNYLCLMSICLAIHAGYNFIFSRDFDLLDHDNGTQIDRVEVEG
jgi:hypothetical protein